MGMLGPLYSGVKIPLRGTDITISWTKYTEYKMPVLDHGSLHWPLKKCFSVQNSHYKLLVFAQKFVYKYSDNKLPIEIGYDFWAMIYKR